jgi:putative endonuclease
MGTGLTCGEAGKTRPGSCWHRPCLITGVANRSELGKLGESIASDELRRRGYAISAIRYRTRFGEIDIVSSLGNVVVFVEVKARRSRAYGGAAEAVSPRKRRRIAAMALDYLAWAGRLESPCRFDVVAIDGIGTSSMTVRVIENAWYIDR